MSKIYVGRIQYKPPIDLPGGWWDALQSLACWVRKALRDAYEDGYTAGKLDALRAAHSYYDDTPKGKRRAAELERLRAGDAPASASGTVDDIEHFLAGFRNPS